MEDEFARDPSPINGFYLGINSFAPFSNPALGPALVSALIPAPVSAPAPALPFFDELFRQFIKTYLKINQEPK